MKGAAGADPLCALVGRIVVPPLLTACGKAGNTPRHKLLLDVAVAIVRGARANVTAATPAGMPTAAAWNSLSCCSHEETPSDRGRALAGRRRRLGGRR